MAGNSGSFRRNLMPSLMLSGQTKKQEQVCLSVAGSPLGMWYVEATVSSGTLALVSHALNVLGQLSVCALNH